MRTNRKLSLVLDYLPAPVIGTFWPYAAEKGAKLGSVVASSRKIAVERTALTLRDLIEANVGAQVLVTETPKSAWSTCSAGCAGSRSTG